ncbi:MAG TPA: helix-turn-helix transcriptional regulator [bacterium]|nr:helix-turn-helix transcriptional regulator [bacterium]HQJ61046.1 helix-turn-helix transcriptional regulator [bacterium]HQM85518.1 helix-turn-helix transcriptional regulator [bacterium]
MDVLKQFGNRVRELREKVGISQEELAYKAELHRTYISSIERGAQNISLRNIQKLAKALGVTMKELV